MRESKEPSRWYLVGLFVFVGALWGLNYKYSGALAIEVKDLEARGLFGDQFGAVNALFSGLAFAGVAFALLMQRHEMKLLQQELARSKDIFESQKTLADEQLAMQRKQAFETTFFNFVALFNDVIENMRFAYSGENILGRPVFEKYLIQIQRIKEKKQDGTIVPTRADDTGTVIDAYEHFYAMHHSSVGHYFRLLYNAVKFVETSDVEDKKFYTNIIRAQLSDDEALLLGMNCLTDRGAKMKPFVEKYSLLKNVSLEKRDSLLKEGRAKLAPSAFE